MKIAATMLGILLLATPLLAADPPPLTATAAISAVTVFPDRAQVTRHAAVKLAAGRQQVLFDGLPVGLQDDSVRVTGSGTAGARVIDVSVRRQYLEKPFGDALKKLIDQKTVAEEGVRAVDGRLTALASQKAFYESVRVGYGERLSKELLAARPGTAEAGEFVRFVGDGLLAVDGKMREAEREKRDLATKIDALNREINQLRGSGAKESRTVVVELEAAKAGETALDLVYLVPGASWAGRSTDATWARSPWPANPGQLTSSRRVWPSALKHRLTFPLSKRLSPWVLLRGSATPAPGGSVRVSS